MARNLALLSAAARQMAEQQAAQSNLARNSAAEPFGRLGIVIAFHPDPFRVRDHRGQCRTFLGVQPLRRPAVVKRVAQRDDARRRMPRHRFAHPADRGAGVVRRQQVAAVRERRAFLKMQVGENQRLLCRPIDRAGFVEQHRLAVHLNVKIPGHAQPLTSIHFFRRRT